MAWNKKAGKWAAALLPLLVATGALAEPGITADSIILGQAAGFTGSVRTGTEYIDLTIISRKGMFVR